MDTEMRDLDALNVRDFWRAAVSAAPDEPFLLYGDDTFTYRQFDAKVRRTAAAWHALGVRKGDRVAFMLENRPGFLAAWLGLASIGGILVAINTRWQAGEVGQFLQLTEPRFAFVSARHQAVFAQALSGAASIERVLTPDTGTPYPLLLDAFSGTEAPDIPLRSADPISFISTSGTTGRPKAVIQTHGSYVLTGEGYAHWVRLRPGERMYLCLPLFHINSQAYATMGPIAARGAIVLAERFSASRFWPDMQRYGVNVFNYIGTMLPILAKRESSPEERAHHVRLTYGGPALPGPERAALEERFGLTILAGIGMSENTFGLIEPLDEERRSGSLGKPRQHPDPRLRNDARVVDDEGREVPSGETGELTYRNPMLMAGYFRQPEETARTIRDGWLYTGDLVYRDQDGYFYFVDRKKDIIRVRGENVAPAEVEEVLHQHPTVLEAAVVGVPAALGEEEIAAFVVPRPDAVTDATAIIAWCRERLADFKAPRSVWFAESLPKTETLRVEKHRLRELARARLANEEATL